MQKKNRIAFIIPRYKVGQAGGAELLVEALSNRLSQNGYEIDVLTTCARDHRTWKNDIHPGLETKQGVRVHRFLVEPRSDLNAFVELEQRLSRGWIINKREEIRWIKGSVHSQALYQALRDQQDQWDVLIFAPYLFGLTYEGIQIVPNKSVIIPCLHDEPYAHLEIFKEMFQKVRGILFNAEPEKKLALELYGLEESKCKIVGMGFDLPRATGNIEAFRKKYGLGNSPYILYAGRKERGKNVELLIHYFDTYKKNVNNALKLVLIGSGKIEKPLPLDTLDLGYVPQEDKQTAYQGATVLCQPSINESFSIVLMESWLMKKPVLVHGHCAVTRDHVVDSGGGLYFENYFQFEEALSYIVEHSFEAEQMGQRGYQYTMQNYNWDRIIEKFNKALETFT